MWLWGMAFQMCMCTHACTCSYVFVCVCVLAPQRALLQRANRSEGPHSSTSCLTWPQRIFSFPKQTNRWAFGSYQRWRGREGTGGWGCLWWGISGSNRVFAKELPLCRKCRTGLTSEKNGVFQGQEAIAKNIFQHIAVNIFEHSWCLGIIFLTK